jgi:hypothetical protein
MYRVVGQQKKVGAELRVMEFMEGKAGLLLRKLGTRW